MKKNLGFVVAIAALVMVLSLSSSAFAYTVGGNVNNAGKYSTAGSLWVALEGTGAFGADSNYPYQYPCFTDPSLPCITLPQPPYAQNDINHNTVDSNYVFVTGKDGSSALYAVGELDPKFAPATSVVTLTCDKNGRCDLAGEGRAVKNVSEIDVFQAVPSIHVNSKSIPFTHFYSSLVVVSGEGITPKTYDLADLQKMKQKTFNASSSSTNTVGDWTGPTLASVLKASGVDTRDMDSYIVVQATDGYAAVLSMYEATQMTGLQYALLAIQDTLGNTINCGTACQNGDNGLARLVLPNDTVAGRWVSNVAQIVVYKLRPKETCMAPEYDK